MTSQGLASSHPNKARPWGQYALVAVPWLVLVLGLAVTFYAWQSQQQAVRAADRIRFEREVQDARNAILARLGVYENMLLGANAYAAVNSGMGLRQWQQYSTSLDLDKRYPGVAALGYAVRVPADQAEAFVAAARRDLVPNYTIRPAGERSEYMPVRLIEPLDRTRVGLGLDLGAEPALRAAAERARDSGALALSPTMNLQAETASSPGFVMLIPVYKAGVPVDTVEARRAAIQGWALELVQAGGIMKGVLGSGAADIALQVYDGSDPAVGSLLYDSFPQTIQLGNAPSFTSTSTFQVGGRPWTFAIHTLPLFDASTRQNEAVLVLSGGLILSALLFGLTLALLNLRSTAIGLARGMTQTLRESEERFRLITENAADLIAVTDKDGKRIYNSPSYARVLGYTPEEMHGTWSFTEIHPDDQVRVMQAAEESLESGVGKMLEFRMRRKDGSWVTLESVGSVIRSETGEVQTLVTVARDVTERKQAEVQMRRQNEYLAALQALLSTRLNLEEVLESILQRAGTLMGTHHGYVFLRDAATGVMQMRIGVGVYHNLVGTRAEIGIGLAGTVWQSGQPLAIEDYRHWGGRLQSTDRDMLRAVVGVPLQAQGNIAGVLGLAYLDEGRKFGASEIETLSRFAGLAAIALENARLYAEAQAELSERKRAQEETRAALQAQQTLLEELNALTRRLTREGWDAYTREALDGASFVVEEGGPSRTYASPPSDSLAVSRNGHRAVTCPVILRGEVIGSLDLQDLDPQRAWSEEDSQMVQAVAEHLALALDNARLLDSAQREVIERTRAEHAMEQQTERLGMLLDLSLELARPQTLLERSLDLITQRAMALLDADGAGVWLPTGENEIELASTRNVGSAIMQGRRLRRGEGLVGQVVARGEMLRVDDYREWAGRSNVFADAPFHAALAVPMIWQGQLKGVLAFTRSQAGRSFQAQDEGIAQLLAAQAAASIENRRLLEETQRRAKELGAVNQVASAISQQLELEGLLETIFEQIREIMPVDGFYVRLYERQTNLVQSLFVSDAGKRYHVPPTPLLPTGNMRRVIETGEPVLVNRTQEELDAYALPVQGAVGDPSRVPASLLYAPLRVGAQVIGVISVQSYQMQAYAAEAVSLLMGIANYVGIAVENARLFQQSQRAYAYLSALQETSMGLIGHLQVDELLQAIVSRAGALAETSHGYVYLREPGQDEMEMRVGTGLYDDLMGARMTRGIGLAGRVWETGQTFKLDDYQLWPQRLSGSRRDAIRAVAGVPLKSGAEVVGVIGLARTEEGRVFAEEEMAILTRFADLAAIALENARLYDQAQRELVERTRAQAEVNASLKEKEVMLKEIHHRVKNNLQVVSSLLNLQSAYIHDPEALALFKESQSRVKSMALVHEKLYQSSDLARIDFDPYIRSLVANLYRTFPVNRERVDVRVQVENVRLGIDQAVPCGLMINELVSNAMKYAFPGDRCGEIYVQLHPAGRRLKLVVGDNGVGLPPGLNYRETESLGLQLVNTLAAQLGGDIELYAEHGAEWRITFDDPEAARAAA